MTMKLWKPYQPSDDLPWNLPRVWMLHRRAGFGANWQQLQRDLQDGPDVAIQRVLDGQAKLDVDEDFESRSEYLSLIHI